VGSELGFLCIPPGSSLREAVQCIDRNEKGIVLVVDEKGRLVGTISDGDVRRAILAGTDLDATIDGLLAQRINSPYPSPVTAPAGTTAAALLDLMREHAVRQVPLVEPDGRVVGLTTWSDLLPSQAPPLQAVIMAGGFGTRLRPLTNETPKPMLPLGGRPLLERTIEQLRDAGISTINLMTHYKSEQILEHFRDGQDFGVQLRYVCEEAPLGTAGALGLLEDARAPILVINGDVLTTVNYRALASYHEESGAVLTIGVRRICLQVPYGVVDSELGHVTAITEKPEISLFVNAGVYLLEPSVCASIPRGQRLDMPDLIKGLLQAGKPVVSYPIIEYWMDVGTLENYEQAQEDSRDGRI